MDLEEGIDFDKGVDRGGKEQALRKEQTSRARCRPRG